VPKEFDLDTDIITEANVLDVRRNKSHGSGCVCGWGRVALLRIHQLTHPFSSQKPRAQTH